MADRLVLIFMIDALGMRQAAEPRFLGTPFLPVLDRKRAPVQSVLGYSSAAIPTIMTGLRPDEHGHFSMYRRAGRDGVFQGWGPLLRASVRLRRGTWQMRRLLSRSLKSRGITGYFSLYNIPLDLLTRFDLCQRLDIYAPGAFPGRMALPDYLHQKTKSRVWSWATPSAQAFAEMEGEIRRGDCRVLFLYSCEFDGLMHAHGPESAAARRALCELDQTITGLVESARQRGRDVRTFVFGDHGMAAVTETHDLWRTLKSLPLRMPHDYLMFLDSTMARFWYFSPEAERMIDELLAGLNFGRVLSEEELRRLGVYFPQGEYGHRIFLLREGAIVVPSFVAQETVAGMHGYHPDDPCSFTTLLTDVHDRPYPRNLQELHTLLRDEILEAGP